MEINNVSLGCPFFVTFNPSRRKTELELDGLQVEIEWKGILLKKAYSVAKYVVWSLGR